MSTTDAYQRARALHDAGRPAESLPAFHDAIREAPLDTDRWYAAARAAMDAGEMQQASSLLERYVRFAAPAARPLYALAMCRFFGGQFDSALQALDRATTLEPDDVSSHMAAGHCLYALGRPDDGYRRHSRALELPARKPSQRTDQALIRIVRGEFAEGWADYEARWGSRAFRPLPAWRDGTHAVWDGAPAPGRTLCLYSEGGLGDTILFARFIPAARARVGRVLVSAQPPVRSLVASMPEVDGTIGSMDDVPADALHASLWSLPHLLGVDVASIPRDVPYLVPRCDAAILGPRPTGAKLRVGVAWAGNPMTHHNADRSLPDVHLLAPLLAIAGVEWISVQVGDRADEASQAGLDVRPCPPLRDFADTACLLRELDLLVSVDTAVVNLAGALGVPAWVIPPSVPEWRWFLDREDSPWYPSVRLFRRASSADWPATIARVAAALRDLVAARDAGGA